MRSAPTALRRSIAVVARSAAWSPARLSRPNWGSWAPRKSRAWTKRAPTRSPTTDTQRWRVTRRPLDQLPPAACLNARRQEWGIENGLHHVLDVSADEDRRLKVRTLNSLCVLTLLSRIGVALWIPGRKKRQSYYNWREEHKARCDGMLKLLRTAPAKVKR